MKKLTIILLGMAAYFWVTECPAATITVNWDGSGDYTTIQAGIDVANELDTIIVAAGTYTENINFGGKNVVLTSIDPNDWVVVGGTIIDGGGLGSVVRFAGSESSDCKLLGFTITNGYGPGDKDGGGIDGTLLWPYTQATVANCIIKDNIAQQHGGGIRHVNGLINRCIIFGNSAFINAGGIEGCHGTISNCLIYDNTATLNGGGMAYCNGDIVNCTIVENTAGVSGGGLAWCSGTITNCIFGGNNLGQLSGSSTPTYSCIEGFYGGVGNINTEPGFVNAAGGDYHLRFDSPCVDAATNDPPGELPATDVEGNIRPLDGDYDDLAVADMGAYELLPPEAPYIVLNQSEFVFHCLEHGPNPAEQILEIRNPGTGSFEWKIVADCKRLEFWPTNGQTSTETDAVTLRVDTAGLEAGGHICELTILSRQAVNSPQTVLVGLNIYNEGDIIVPLDYATIQGAIDAAWGDETIIVEPGTYNEKIYFAGKNITLRSIKPENKTVVKRTIIQGDGTDRVVTFAGSEEANCWLVGFTITGGGMVHGGAGIRGLGTQASIANCIISSNIADGAGGGIQSVDGTIDKCIIFGNRAGERGGGIAGCHGRITNCFIYGNEAVGSGGGIINCNGDIVNCLVYGNRSYDWGGGISSCGGDIINCTITANLSGDDYGGGLGNCFGTITNCIIWGNAFNQLSGSSRPTYSCYPGGGSGTGNINTEPEFVNESKHDYRLRPGSPCVDAGTNEPPGGMPVVDIDGNIRPIDGNYDGQAVADIGAYELTELIGIEITGPGKVTENSMANYELIGRHEGGIVGGMVGGWVNWWVEPTTYASINDDGVLWTQEVDSRQKITIYAEYIMNEMRMEAEKVVSILPVCPEGSALQFDGEDDYVEIAGFSGVLGVRSRTVSAWIKTTMTTIGEIISWGYQPTNVLMVGGAGNWVFMVLAEGNLRLGVGSGGIEGSTNVADGQWHHVAAVLQSNGTPNVSDIKLYVDGIEESTIGDDRQINTAGGANVRIGGLSGWAVWWPLGDFIWPPWADRYFEGAIDEVRIWNVARTQEEIRANMHRRLEGNEAGLVGYWNFDEGQGGIVYDSSPKGNKGYLRHGPVWVDSDAPIGFCNIEADVHIVPRTINRRSRMKRVIAIIRLPDGVGRHDIADEPFLLYPADLDDEPIEAIWQRVIGWRRKAMVFALFDKAELMDAVEHNGRVELTVVGRLESSQYIYGSDTVRIMQPRPRPRMRLRLR